MSVPEPDLPLYVPVSEAPKRFSISRATIYRYAARGDITIHKAGNRSLLKTSEIVSWIENSNPSND